MEEVAYNPQEDKLEGIRRLGNVLRMMGDNSINNSLGILDYVGRIIHKIGKCWKEKREVVTPPFFVSNICETHQ